MAKLSEGKAVGKVIAAVAALGAVVNSLSADDNGLVNEDNAILIGRAERLQKSTANLITASAWQIGALAMMNPPQPITEE